MDLPAKRPRQHDPWPTNVLETLVKAEYDTPGFEEAFKYLTWRLEGRKPYSTWTISVGHGNGYYWLIDMWLVKSDDGRFASITVDTCGMEHHTVSLHEKRDEAFRAGHRRAHVENEVYPPTEDDLAKAFGVPTSTVRGWVESAWKLLDKPPHFVTLWLCPDGRGVALPYKRDPEEQAWTAVGDISGELASASHAAMMHEIFDLTHKQKFSTLVFAIDTDKPVLKQAILACLDNSSKPTPAQIDLVNELLSAEGTST